MHICIPPVFMCLCYLNICSCSTISNYLLFQILTGVLNTEFVIGCSLNLGWFLFKTWLSYKVIVSPFMLYTVTNQERILFEIHNCGCQRCLVIPGLTQFNAHVSCNCEKLLSWWLHYGFCATTGIRLSFL